LKNPFLKISATGRSIPGYQSIKKESIMSEVKTQETETQAEGNAPATAPEPETSGSSGESGQDAPPAEATAPVDGEGSETD
jgi:hypothetical protein